MKKLSLILMSLLLSFGAVSCSNNSDEIEGYKKKIEKLESEIAELKGDTGAKDKDAMLDALDGTISVNFGEKYTIPDIMEFSLSSVSWADELRPSNTEGAYSYYEDKADETYLVIRGTLTNLGGKEIDVDYMHKSEVVVNGKYTFNVAMRTEDSDGSNFYGDTKPLQTVNFIVYASVSDGVKDVFEDATFTLNVQSDPEKVGNFMRDDDAKTVYTFTVTSSDIA